jgi:hypothetical protein
MIVGQFAAFQLRDTTIKSFQLKAELNNVNVTNEQFLIYYYYISNIGQKSITIRKEEVDGTMETIDFVTSSPFNGWIKREVFFNATESGYKVKNYKYSFLMRILFQSCYNIFQIYFDLQKTSSEISLIHIALVEISIRQVNAGM